MSYVCNLIPALRKAEAGEYGIGHHSALTLCSEYQKYKQKSGYLVH